MASSIKPVIDAFLNKKLKKITNTESKIHELYLFGNKIAEWRGNDIYICNGGYVDKKGNICSATTKDRLSMLGARISQVKGRIYLNGVLWNGDWIKLGDTPKQEIKQQKQTLFS